MEYILFSNVSHAFNAFSFHHLISLVFLLVPFSRFPSSLIYSCKNISDCSYLEDRELLTRQDKVILFIGRITCPYCQLFVPKLASVSAELEKQVYYLNSEDMQDFTAIQSLRNDYGVATVPGLLVANSGEVKVVCDSSLSEEEITAFIQA